MLWDTLSTHSHIQKLLYGYKFDKNIYTKYTYHMSKNYYNNDVIPLLQKQINKDLPKGGECVYTYIYKIYGIYSWYRYFSIYLCVVDTTEEPSY